MPTAMKADSMTRAVTKAEGEDFVLPLEDREQRQGGADVGDDEEQLQEGSQQHAGVGASTGDVAGVLENGGVEHEVCGDRGDVGDEEEHARQPCKRLRIPPEVPGWPREALLAIGRRLVSCACAERSWSLFLFLSRVGEHVVGLGWWARRTRPGRRE